MAKGRVIIDIDMCKGCELCVSVCPKKILELDEHNINLGGYNPAKCINESECIACVSCARMCPEVAITVEKFD